MQVLGICRFSYLATSGFQSQTGDLDQRKALLFDPVRMEERFLYFEHIFLPGIRAQTNTAFTLIVLTSDCLPSKYDRRLSALVADIPQIKLIHMPPKEHRLAVSEVIQAEIDPNADYTAQFRLDDDDGVSVRFVQNIRNHYKLLGSFIAHHKHVALDYNHGILLTLGKNGVCATEVKETFWTPALVMFLPPDHHRTIINYPHFRIQNMVQSVTVTKPIMFVRGLNSTNDSPFWQGRKPPSPVDTSMEKLLRDKFAISVPALQKALQYNS